MTDGTFDDLLAANKRYARSAPREFDGIAHQGVMILTCMDSRIEPLEMVGLMIGEAKILRTAGARLTAPTQPLSLSVRRRSAAAAVAGGSLTALSRVASRG